MVLALTCIWIGYRFAVFYHAAKAGEQPVCIGV
jgi:hypothetical protein